MDQVDTLYLVSSTDTNVNVRFCHKILNVFSVQTAEHPLVTCTAPFHLHFQSRSTGNRGNTRGVHLEYTQLPCRLF